MGKIYRFLSFESFVNIVLTKCLTFVHPSLWEDPYEEEILNKYIEEVIKREDAIDAIIQYIITQRVYCSSWTRVSESDALWRIYSHNNNSIRIETDENKIKFLDSVILKDIIYVKDINSIKMDSNDFYKSISFKREAFSHESEIRLITHYKYRGIKDAEDKIKAFLLFYGGESDVRKRLLDNIKIDEIEEIIEKALRELSFDIDKIHVSYEHIDNFIESVMLNPFADEWLNDTLKMFCEEYNVKYIGKSELYKKISN